MSLQEKIEKILHTEQCSPLMREKRDETYNPFGRQEKLEKTLAFRAGEEFKKRLMLLSNWAEIVRTVLEHELDTGEFILRNPQPKKRGRAGDPKRTGADVNLAVRVSETFFERITSVPRWQAKAREALAERLDDLLESIPDDLVS